MGIMCYNLLYKWAHSKMQKGHFMTVFNNEIFALFLYTNPGIEAVADDGGIYYYDESEDKFFEVVRAGEENEEVFERNFLRKALSELFNYAKLMRATFYCTEVKVHD